MTVLSYPIAGLPLVVAFGLLAPIAVPLFAFAGLVVLLVITFAAIVALGWGVIASFRAAARSLPWRSGPAPRRT